jgi:hypothetical protein
MNTLNYFLLIIAILIYGDLLHTYFWVGLDESEKRFYKRHPVYDQDSSPREAFVQELLLIWIAAGLFTLGFIFSLFYTHHIL